MRFNLEYLEATDRVIVTDTFSGSSKIVDNKDEAIKEAIKGFYKADVYFLNDDFQEQHAQHMVDTYCKADLPFVKGDEK